MVCARVQLLELAHAECRHRLARSEIRVTVRMRAPEHLVVELEHEIVWRIVDHPDLLEHDLSLELEILPPEQRTEDQIADDISGFDEMLIEHARLIRRMLARGVRIERAAQLLERQRDLPRRANLRSLEHHVLEQMGHTHT